MPSEETRIATVGRLGRVSRGRLAGAMARRRIRAARHLSQRAACLVVGHGAMRLFQSGRLALLIARSDRWNVPVVSEHTFLRRLQLLPPLPPEPRPFSAADVGAQSGLSENALRLLVLFDIIEPEDGRYSFRDLRACRNFGRLVAARRDLPAALAKALEIREGVSFRRHLAELVLAPDNEVRIGTLDLGDRPESFDSLWESALAAQLNRDYEEAAEGYRRCAAMRPRDTHCLFNLASVLSRLGEKDEARALLEKAVALKPCFPEALFELAMLSDGAARVRLLERTVAEYPDHLAAVHELAMAYTEAEKYARALPLWERFLSLASAPSAPPLDPGARERARKALLLCRMIGLTDRSRGTTKT